MAVLAHQPAKPPAPTTPVLGHRRPAPTLLPCSPVRFVPPQSQAEAHFPRLEEQSGMSLAMTDTEGETHTLRFRFWANNQSRLGCRGAGWPAEHALRLPLVRRQPAARWPPRAARPPWPRGLRTPRGSLPRCPCSRNRVAPPVPAGCTFWSTHQQYRPSTACRPGTSWCSAGCQRGSTASPGARQGSGTSLACTASAGAWPAPAGSGPAPRLRAGCWAGSVGVAHRHAYAPASAKGPE